MSDCFLQSRYETLPGNLLPGKGRCWISFLNPTYTTTQLPNAEQQSGKSFNPENQGSDSRVEKSFKEQQVAVYLKS